MNPLAVLWEYRVAFLNGFSVTIELVVGAVVLGTLLGVFLEWACRVVGRPLRFIVDALAFAASAIPALVILFWLYYPAQSLTGVFVSPFTTALIALTILSGFGVYRIVADAVHAFPKQFIVTAMVSGLSPKDTVRYIQAPLLIRAALPRWIDLQVVILQTSVFASLISVDEVFRAAQRVNSVIYQPVIIYTAMALVFLATAGSAMFAAQALRRRYERDFSER